MSKRRKHRKHGSSPQQAADTEMYRCEVCKKGYPFSGNLHSPASTPFMFIVYADPEHRRFSLGVCSTDMQKFEGEEALWFVCSDRQCIFKSFLMWREWDRQMSMAAFAMKQVGALAREMPATPIGKELEDTFQQSLLRRAGAFCDKQEEVTGDAGPHEAARTLLPDS